eukprot:12067675-Alexandrium_andersonii.AAC.1
MGVALLLGGFGGRLLARGRRGVLRLAVPSSNRPSARTQWGPVSCLPLGDRLVLAILVLTRGGRVCGQPFLCDAPSRARRAG